MFETFYHMSSVMRCFTEKKRQLMALQEISKCDLSGERELSLEFLIFLLSDKCNHVEFFKLYVGHIKVIKLISGDLN
jgi:hypothetical protein